MERYEKVLKKEKLEELKNNLNKLIKEYDQNIKIQNKFKEILSYTEEELTKINISEIPLLITSYLHEDNIYYVYYLADLDDITININEMLPNTIDLQDKLNIKFNIIAINNTRNILDKLIKEIIIKNNVNNWIEVSILLERKVNEKGLNKQLKKEYK